MGKKKSISRQSRRESLKTSLNLDLMNLSGESLPSDESKISTQLKTPTSRQNGLGIRRDWRKRRAPVKIANQNGTRFRYSGKKRYSERFATPTCTLNCANHDSTSIHLPASKQSVPSIFPLRGEPEGQEHMLCTFPAKASKFQASSKPCVHTQIPFNDPASHYVKTKGCSGNTFQSEKRLYCSPARTSNSAASSSRSSLVTHFIRTSEIPSNIGSSLTSSTTSSRGLSYSTPLSFHATHSTPMDNSALEEMVRNGIMTQNINQAPACSFGISPIETTSQMTSSQCSTTLSSFIDSPILNEESISRCSTMAEAGSMRSSPRDALSPCRDNSQNSSDPYSPNINQGPTSIKPMPQNINQAPACSFRVSPIETTSQMTSSQCSTTLSSILIDSPVLNEESISRCSTMAEAGSMRSSPRDALSPSRDNSHNSSHPHSPIFIVPNNTPDSLIYSVLNSSPDSPICCVLNNSLLPPKYRIPNNTPETPFSSEENLFSDNSGEDIKSAENPTSDYFSYGRNSAHPKSSSEEYSQNIATIKIGNSLKTSILPGKRQCPSQLQTEASPANTSSSLRKSKHIENTTGCISQFAFYPDELFPHPNVRTSCNSKAANLFLEEGGGSYSMASLYPEKHASKSVATLNPIKSLPSSDERNRIESLRQSFTSLSLTHGPSTEAPEMFVPSNKPDSKQSSRSRNKTRKKSKLSSFFTACFRSPSPTQENEI